MGSLRNVALRVLQQTPCRNKKAQLEEFSDDFDKLMVTLKTLNFL